MSRYIEVIESRIKSVEGYAARDFAGHVATLLVDQDGRRQWRCATPGGFGYWFHVITVPGSLIVMGDIGDLILHRTEDMLGWAAGAVNSISYFAEKVPHAIPTDEYARDAARAAVEGQADWMDECDQPEQAAKLRELLTEDWHFDNEWSFISAVYEALDDPCEFSSYKAYTSNFLWCREAVKWLLRDLGMLKEAKTEARASA